MKRRIIALVMVFSVLCTSVYAAEVSTPASSNLEVSFQANMAGASRSVASTSTYGDFSLEWENGGSFGNVTKVYTDSMNVVYDYDASNRRISKICGPQTITFSYSDVGLTEGKLQSENRDGMVITYNYGFDGYDVSLLSFTTGETTYYYDYDSNGTVVSLLDESGEIVSDYDYENNIVSHIWEKDVDGVWVDKLGDEEAIGSINLIRYLGYYFDEETQWYYCGRLYDAVSGCFVTATTTTDMIVPRSISSTPSYVFTTSLNLFDSCMDDPDFGASIDYERSGAWCSSLSEVETLTRMIYAENTYESRHSDRVGEAWVVANRSLSGSYPTNLKSICTQSGQFESITGSESRTDNARNPDTTSEAWTEAVSIACCTTVCFRYGDYSEDYLEDLMSRPNGLTDQLYFVGLEYFSSVCRDGTNGLMYNFGTSAGYVDIQQVVVLDVDTNLTTRAQVRAIESPYKYNIFFNEE